MAELRDLSCEGYFFNLHINGFNSCLNGIHFGFGKVNFTALPTNKGWHFVQNQMVAVAVNVKGRYAALHFALAIHTLHNLNPYAKIIRPIILIRQVGRDESQIIVFRRTNKVKRALVVAPTEH